MRLEYKIAPRERIVRGSARDGRLDWGAAVCGVRLEGRSALMEAEHFIR